MVMIFENTTNQLNCLQEYEDLFVSGDGMRRYLQDLGYSWDEVEDILGYGYFQGESNNFFVLDLDGRRLIAEANFN